LRTSNILIPYRIPELPVNPIINLMSELSLFHI
jgi:hypothetical protein